MDLFHQFGVKENSRSKVERNFKRFSKLAGNANPRTATKTAKHTMERNCNCTKSVRTVTTQPLSTCEALSVKTETMPRKDREDSHNAKSTAAKHPSTVLWRYKLPSKGSSEQQAAPLRLTPNGMEREIATEPQNHIAT